MKLVLEMSRKILVGQCADCAYRFKAKNWSTCEFCLRNPHITDNWAPIVIIGKCSICGGSVERDNEYSTWSGNARFCSMVCAQIYIKKLEEKCETAL